jgi:uroporphyrinogen decarboxylase
MKSKSTMAVLGGIDQNGALRTGTTDDAKEKVLDAVRAAGIERLVVAPGCVIPIDTPEDNIHAVVDAIRSITPWDKEWEAFS